MFVNLEKEIGSILDASSPYDVRTFVLIGVMGFVSIGLYFSTFDWNPFPLIIIIIYFADKKKKKKNRQVVGLIPSFIN